jgi:hypothetical protein
MHDNICDLRKNRRERKAIWKLSRVYHNDNEGLKQGSPGRVFDTISDKEAVFQFALK